MINEQEDIPLDTVRFIEALDAGHPHRCIRADEDVIAHHRYAAVRDFIDQLLLIKQEIEEGDENDHS
jgi:hypothetical protein